MVCFLIFRCFASLVLFAERITNLVFQNLDIQTTELEKGMGEDLAQSVNQYVGQFGDLKKKVRLFPVNFYILVIFRWKNAGESW